MRSISGVGHHNMIVTEAVTMKKREPNMRLNKYQALPKCTLLKNY
jgi:hypothetical protein